MKTTAVWIGFATMTLAAASLAGQSPTSVVFKAVGCINRAGQSGSIGGTAGMRPATPATAGVLANSSDPTNVFMLNGATLPDSTKETRAHAAAGHPPTALPAAYVLDGKAQDFEAHLGHRVEVTGTLVATNDGGPEATKSNVKHIQVASIRMLSPRCPMTSTVPLGK